MTRRGAMGMVVFMAMAALGLRSGQGNQTVDPATLLDEGLRHMGGRDRIAAVTRVRFDMMTFWQRTSFDDLPYPDIFPSGDGYEHNLEARDYGIPAWRSTRNFGLGPNAQSVVDVVRDSVAITRTTGRDFRPLSIAYVDERDELYAYTPDRLMLWARDAADLTAAGDTVIAGVPHALVRATVNGIPMTLYLRRSDGLVTMTAFRKAQNNDFGLVPFGEMAVQVWYARWKTFPPGITIPTEWDVRRAGAAYKRIAVLAAEFDPDFEADSFAVSPEQRAAYLASDAVRPMHDLPLDSARVVEGFLADFRTFGSPSGALLMGDRWLLLDAGQAPLSGNRAIEWLERESGMPVAAAVLGTSTRGLYGGITALLDRGIPVTLGVGAARLARATLAGYGGARRKLDVIDRGRWMDVGEDSVYVEPIDLPDTRGALVLWSPSRRWLFAPDAFTPLDRDLVLERARARGWQVERLGTGRGLLGPI